MVKKNLIIIAFLLLILTPLIQKCHSCDMLVYIGEDLEHIKNGKIMLIFEDNHNFGSGEFNSEIFAIIKSADMPLKEALLYYGYLIDTTQLSANDKASLIDNKRLALTKTNLLKCVKTAVAIEP